MARSSVTTTRAATLILIAGIGALIFGGATSVRADEEAPTVVAAGNVGDCTSDGDEATGELVASIEGTVLVLGDNAYPDGTAASYENCYEPTWGRFRERTRSVPGNHDYGTPGAEAYFAYFGEAAGPPPGGYYSFDLGSWHVIALNSVCEEVACGTGSPQLDWLRRDLRQTDAECLLAYWHHPRFSSGRAVGSDQSMETAWRMLDDAGVDLVLTAHSHHYERFAPQDHRGTPDPDGIRQFVVGTGGAELHDVGFRLLNSEVATAESHGVLRLELGESQYAWDFLSVAGVALDEGTGECGDHAPDLRSLLAMLAPALLLVPLIAIVVALIVSRPSDVRII